MITNHFKERFKERVMDLGLSKKIIKEIMKVCMEECWNSKHQYEGICVYKFDKSDLPKYDTENQLWILVRDKHLITTWRRSEFDTRFTTNEGMNVDNIRYVNV